MSKNWQETKIHSVVFSCHIFPFWGFKGKLTYFTGGGEDTLSSCILEERKKIETSEFRQVHSGQGGRVESFEFMYNLWLSLSIISDWLMNRLYYYVYEGNFF